MRRDRLMAGTRLGEIDFEWLIANLEVGTLPYGVDEEQVGNIDTFVLGPKAVHAAETYVLGLFQLYPTVYFHKATRSAEKIFTELLFSIISLVRDGSISSTPENHPLVRLAKEPDNIKCVLQLDDAVVWGALSMMAEAKDRAIASFSMCLRDRRLFKCFDVRAQLIQGLGEAKADEAIVEKACTSIVDRVEEWTKRDNNRARILIDRATREPYKRFQESKGPLNQIMIRAVDGKLVDLGERSKIVKAIDPFRLCRIYLADNDNEAKNFAQEAIKTEVIDAARLHA